MKKIARPWNKSACAATTLAVVLLCLVCFCSFFTFVVFVRYAQLANPTEIAGDTIDEPIEFSTATATPEPSVTPKPPTAVPSPAHDYSAEIQYIETVSRISTNLSDMFSALGKQSGAVEKSPAVIFTNQWRRDTVKILTGMKLICKEIRALKPPSSLAKVHAELLDAASHIDLGADLFAAGIDDVDANKIKQANEQFSLSVESIRRATERLGESAKEMGIR